MDVDPLASMRCWAITLELGGQEFEVPALPAVDWWPILTSVQPRQVLDLLVSSADLDEMILDGKLTAAELGQACTDVIEEATGRSLHASFVLALAADGNWANIGGALSLAGFRWDVMPIGAALDAIYATIVGNLGDEARGKFLEILDNESLTQPGKKRTPSERVLTEFEAMAGPRPAPSVPGQGPGPQQSSAEPSDSGPPRTHSPRQQRHRGGPSAEPRKPRAPRARSGPAASS